jgi:hypothetical protein
MAYANNPRGYQAMLNAAKAIGLAAQDLLSQSELRGQVKAEWQRQQGD